METHMAPKDELIEEWDWKHARPTGRAISRARAHSEGIAHEGVHLWVVRTVSVMPEILFQHRARTKELYPDCLDITVGGHVVFGHNERKIQKESYEEIGIDPPDGDLIDLGYYRYEERDGGLFHREFQRVYLLHDNRALNRYIFTDGEVEGIFAVPLNHLEILMHADFSFEIGGFTGGAASLREVSRRDFHPLLFAEPMMVYMEMVFRAVHEYVENGTVTSRMPSPV